MRKKHPRFLQLLFAASFLAFTFIASADVDEQTRADFVWFNGLGFPNVQGKPLVRVATGQWSQSPGNEPQNSYIKAFLLGTNGNEFTVFTLDLFTRNFKATKPGTAAHQQVSFEVLNLREVADAEIKSLQNPPSVAENMRRRFGEKITERAEVFTLALACWHDGLTNEAQSLYREAAKMDPHRGSSPPEPSFRVGLEKDIGNSLMWRAVVDFGDPKIPRIELLQQFETILTNYPHSDYCDRARETAAILKRMIAEEEQHAKAGNTNLSQLSTNDQVRELIFRLRDQNGSQYSQPGSCDIFASWPQNTNTPAHQLVRLGYAAVPQLIAVLDSDTLTRSVGYWRDFVFSHHVLTVGDCAEAILRRVTGKSFFAAASTYSYMSKDGKAPSARKAAEAWWSDFQKKGEKQMLVEDVEAGHRDAANEAAILCEKYPDEAVEALARGAHAATDDWTRSRLIEQIAKLDQPAVREFLKDELEHGPTIESRVAAAFGLRSSQKELAIQAMAREWAKVANPKESDNSSWKEIVQFLGSCDSVEAVNDLASNSAKRSPLERFEMVEVLGRQDPTIYLNQRAEPRSVDTTAAIEKCLVAALDDTDQRMGMSGSYGDKSFSDPRICDMAGYYLNQRWPARYPFDLSAPLKTRDRQRLACMNTWRQAHGLPAVPLPKQRETKVPREQSTKVTLIEWSTNSVPPSKEFATRLAQFEGKPLDADKFVSLLAAFAKQPEPGSWGISLLAVKDEDLTGVAISVNLLPAHAGPAKALWDCNERVMVGRNSVQSSNGAGIEEIYSSEDKWADFKGALAQALAADAETPFEIRVRLTKTE